jgi:hypothetical protein
MGFHNNPLMVVGGVWLAIDLFRLFIGLRR